MKYLIVSGDSWTEANYFSRMYLEEKCEWPKWPQLLADKLNMKVINLAKSGQGNEYIYSTLLDKILDTNPEEIGMVIAAWSSPERRDYYSNNWHADRPDIRGNFKYFVQRSHRLYYSFQQVCESLNIKYRQVQMLSFFKNFIWETKEADTNIRHDLLGIDEKEILKDIIESKYTHNINKNFIGWPAVEELGGYSIQDQIRELRLQIGIADTHPNALGHETIANYIYDRL